jgi:hypothetical protein
LCIRAEALESFAFDFLPLQNVLLAAPSFIIDPLSVRRLARSSRHRSRDE